MAQVVVEHHLGGGGAEERLSRRHGGDAADEVGIGRILQQITARAGLQRLRDERLLGVHAENEHADVREAPQDLTRRFDTAQQRHPDVEHHHVGLERQREPHGFAAVGRFATTSQPS